MIAAGVGLPLHFLAEPESSTKTTAEASGNPTYRRFAERQRAMCWFLQDLLRVAVERRAYFDPSVDPAAQISVSGGDISARDNAELADAGQKAAAIASGLHEKGLISSEEMLRLVYRFMGEQLPAVADKPERTGLRTALGYCVGQKTGLERKSMKGVEWVNSEST